MALFSFAWVYKPSLMKAVTGPKVIHVRNKSITFPIYDVSNHVAIGINFIAFTPIIVIHLINVHILYKFHRINGNKNMFAFGHNFIG